MKREVKIYGVYRHFKGNMYIVEGIAQHSETLEKMVIYRALYGDNELWCRPYDLFVGKVDHEEYPEVEQEYRFELVKYED